MYGIKRKPPKTDDPNLVVGSVSKSRLSKINFHLSKPIIIAAVAIVLVIAAAMLWHRQQTTHTQAAKTKHELLMQANQYLLSNDTVHLVPITKQIMQQPGYTHDPDYIYVLLAYSIDASDANHADLYYGLLNQVYKPGKGYDADISDVAKPPQKLKSIVDFLDTQRNDVQKHSFTVQEPAGL